MALDRNVSAEYSNVNIGNDSTEKDTKDTKDIFGSDYDPERQGSKASTGRRMSRIAPPIKAPIEGGDVDSGLSVGDQIEMEKENAIKYRTCSWRKV